MSQLFRSKPLYQILTPWNDMVFHLIPENNHVRNVGSILPFFLEEKLSWWWIALNCSETWGAYHFIVVGFDWRVGIRCHHHELGGVSRRIFWLQLTSLSGPLYCGHQPYLWFRRPIVQEGTMLGWLQTLANPICSLSNGDLPMTYMYSPIWHWSNHYPPLAWITSEMKT